MLVVKVELHSAISGDVRELGRMLIANDGTGTAERGNYTVKVGRKLQDSNAAIFTKPQREAEVKDHARLQLPVWTLVAKALKAARY